MKWEVLNEKVRFAICGAGHRGSNLVTQVLCVLDAVEIIAVCDLSREKAEALAGTVKEKKGNSPVVYADHMDLLNNETPDAILIATSIETYASIAIDAMEKGVAVGMEVGGAGKEADRYRLVEAYERTKTPFMFLENCCYGEAELFAASLKKHGVLGEIVETLIQCENGELIHVHLDTTLPTFYSREITLRGTRGLYQQDGNIVMVEGDKFGRFHDALNSADRYKDQYLPEVWKTTSEEIRETGHGGMDYLMLRSFVDALLRNKEMPIDVYDAASWLSIGYLTKESIAKGGASVEIPDFTKGAYKFRPPLDVIDL